MAEKVFRDLSTPEKRAWWEGIDRAAARATKLVPAKPKKHNHCLVWKAETEKTGSVNKE